jgi:hypothetical protein
MAIGIPGQLPGQSMAGPVATGQAYAQQIAGGMPMEQVIAPGVSYSPEQPMGYTQEDLTPKFVGEGPVLVMPKAPTKGTPFAPNEGFVQMPSAPQGVTGPTRLLPSLQGLDFSGLPRFEDIRDIRGVEDITPTLFDIDVEEILKDIDTQKFEDIDLTGIDIPAIPQVPVMPTVPVIQQPITPSIPQVPVMPEVPVMPTAPVFKEPMPFVPEIQNIPMNFTGLPQMPVMPNIPVMPELPIVPQPIVPQPIQPMNFTRLSNLPVSNFVQPSVEEIVSPISRSKTLPQTSRGLFSL